MTDLERMADEAGAFMPSEYWSGTIYELARFADLIRADEREKNAKICEAVDAGRKAMMLSNDDEFAALSEAAAAIRASR